MYLVLRERAVRVARCFYYACSNLFTARDVLPIGGHYSLLVGSQLALEIPLGAVCYGEADLP
jgi:hypothetical protein